MLRGPNVWEQTDGEAVDYSNFIRDLLKQCADRGMTAREAQFVFRRAGVMAKNHALNSPVLPESPRWPSVKDGQN